MQSMTQSYNRKNGKLRSEDILNQLPKTPTHYIHQPQTLEQVLSHGEEAGRVINSPIMQVAWSQMIQAINQQWIESGPEEKAKQADLHRLIQLSSLFKDILVQYMEQAKYEQAQILQREHMERQAMEAGVPQHEL